MKKAFSIFLTFIFLLSTSGFAVNIHYCPVKDNFSLGSSASHDSSCCGTNSMPDNCCKKETKYFKVKTDFSSTSFVVLPHLKIFTAVFSVASIIPETIVELSHFVFYADSSPPQLPVSRFILFRSILI